MDGSVPVADFSPSSLLQPAELPHERARWRILVVEDVPSLQKLLVTMLQKSGHDVITADDGVDAVELFRTDLFDAVLMDIHMPRMDGLEATRQIRQIESESHRHTTIVAVTAHALPGDARDCVLAGADAYVPKPIDLLELMKLLGRLLSRS